jgi:hypothetical protein
MVTREESEGEASGSSGLRRSPKIPGPGAERSESQQNR